MRSFMRENSPFSRDSEFLAILDDPKFRHGEITLQTILDLHKGVMDADGQNEAAGQLRTCNVSVGKHFAIDHSQVKARMLVFVECFNEMVESGPMGAGEIAARCQHRLVFIHPFLDGTGRTSRLLMNMVLLRRGFEPVSVQPSN